MLAIENDEILITDYDSSLLFNELFYDVKLSKDKRILQCFKSNLFYQQVDDNQLKKNIEKINQIDFRRMVSELPDALINPPNKDYLSKKIEDKK